jgi:hypothetical protein
MKLDIERLAREAGFVTEGMAFARDQLADLERFAALVLEEAAEKGRQTIRLRAMKSQSRIGDDQAVYDSIRALKGNK